MWGQQVQATAERSVNPAENAMIMVLMYVDTSQRPEPTNAPLEVVVDACAEGGEGNHPSGCCGCGGSGSGEGNHPSGCCGCGGSGRAGDGNCGTGFEGAGEGGRGGKGGEALLSGGSDRSARAKAPITLSTSASSAPPVEPRLCAKWRRATSDGVRS